MWTMWLREAGSQTGLHRPSEVQELFGPEETESQEALTANPSRRSEKTCRISLVNSEIQTFFP
jgi:hypothetical protein